MPWDSVDKPRDEDLTDRRKRTRRIRRRLSALGRRVTDSIKTDSIKDRFRPLQELESFHAKLAFVQLVW